MLKYLVDIHRAEKLSLTYATIIYFFQENNDYFMYNKWKSKRAYKNVVSRYRFQILLFR